MRVGIEELYLSPSRKDKRVPRVPASLAIEMKELGQVNPVIVKRDREGRYEILKNAETWLAVGRAGRRSVEIVLNDNLSPEQSVQLINSELDSDALSEARWYQQQLNSKPRKFKNISELASYCDKSRSHISHSLRLLTLPSTIQEAVSSGLLSTGHGKALLSLKKGSCKIQLALTTIKEKLSVRDLEFRVRELNSGAENKSSVVDAKTKTLETLRLEKQLSEHLRAKVEIDENLGVMKVDYRKNLKVLSGILDQLGYQEEF